MNIDRGPLQGYDFEAGAILQGRFQIRHKIATGGMGNIFLCDDQQENIPVAIKVLHRAYLKDSQYLKRFVQEVAIARKIQHPNVVKIFDLYQEENLVFFSMEYIYGDSLEKNIGRKKYSENEICRLMIEVADGLQAIHRESLIHRDLKPGNIMCQLDGSHKIIDFGVSRVPNSKLTTKNIRVGSVGYIAPEVWLGKKITPASDFYSLGCLLYEIINDQLPFQDNDILKLMQQHCQAPVPEFISSTPQWIEEIVCRLLLKNPEERLSSEELIQIVRENNLDSQRIQTFNSTHDTGTLRSGQSIITVVDKWQANHRAKTIPRKENLADQQKLLFFSLKATRPAELENTFNKIEQQRRGRTVVLNLPMNTAMVFNFELPSKDFLFLGVFLGSLNLFDWYLTHEGVSNFGVMAEGNQFLKRLMLEYGVKEALFFAKASTVFIVLILTVLARKSKMVKDLVGFLSIVYLVAAIIPWIYILYYK